MSASSPSAVLPSRHQKDCPNVCLRFSWKETGRFTLGDTHRVGNTLVRHNLTPRDTVPIATDFMLLHTHTLLSIIEPISDSKEIFDIEISNLCGVLVLPFSRALCSHHVERLENRLQGIRRRVADLERDSYGERQIPRRLLTMFLTMEMGYEVTMATHPYSTVNSFLLC